MNGMFELLDPKERRILGSLCLVFILSLLFLFVVALREKRLYFKSLDLIKIKKESAQKMGEKRLTESGELRRWQKTLSDIKELKTKFFYKEEEGISPLVRDTQQILNEARMRVSQKKFDYADLKEDMFRIVRISFETTSSYVTLKKFIHSVEAFPRFLVVQKIDFLDVDPFSGELKVQVALVAYYEK